MTTVVTKKNEMDFVNNIELRNQYMERTEVLNKVKELFLLPKLQMMTTQQVADYYGVDKPVVDRIVQRNREEIVSDGITSISVSELVEVLHEQDVHAKQYRGYKEIELGDGVTMRLPNFGVTNMFPKRAILRIGMLLRDSEVAKEVRTQLLNVFEESSDEQRTVQIDAEMEILNKMSLAFTNQDLVGYMTASCELYQFQKRHINALTEENNTIKTENENLDQSNKMLAGEILAWTDRASVNKAVRVIASMLEWNFGWVWKELYDELLYKHGINLRSRQKKNESLLSHVKENEWESVQSSLSAICENHGLSPSFVFNKAKMN